MKIGIVGHEGAKFTPDAEARARSLIRLILGVPNPDGPLRGLVMVSGHCHLGGIDIWAEEEAAALGVELEIYPPKALSWAGGYKDRNIQIAKASDVVHCLVVTALPPDYHGMRFTRCYHCGTDRHVKSGGCWTAKFAQRIGKVGRWHEIPQHAD